MMDENQFGANINTTPVHRYVRDGPYPVQQCLCNSRVMGSIPSGGNLQGPRQGQGPDGKLLSFFLSFVFPCALMLSPLLGIPNNAGVMYHFRPLVAPQKAWLRHPILLLSPFFWGSPRMHCADLGGHLPTWRPRPGPPPVSFWLKTWIWQGHHLGSRMAKVESSPPIFGKVQWRKRNSDVLACCLLAC